FYSSMRIDVRKAEQLKGSGNEFIGARTRAKIVKNKVSPPFKEGEFDIMYGTGISREGEIVDMGVKFGIINKSGAWFSYGETRLGQGRDNVKTLLKNEPELAAELDRKVREEFNRIKSGKGTAEAETTVSETPVQKPAPKRSAGSVRAKIDIAVDDDDE
ncbi:MAG: DNA recombination/repair protein RecA, partial [Oscillospiraceae bacterium]|nr:DNA recombination/repair protein RecA [Oscillospiraceae bacterium]